MIFDKIENINMYVKCSNYFKKAVEYIEKQDLSKLEVSRFNIDGGNVYGFVSVFEAKDPAEVKYESHKKYIDIQCVIGGAETIYWANTKDITVCSPYSDEKDIVFYNDAETFVELAVKPGYFAVFFPEDAHKPCCKYGGEVSSLKLVIKVRAV